MLALATALLPLILRIPDLIKVGFEVTSILKSDPGTTEEVKVKLTEYDKRLGEALEAVRSARLPRE